VPERRRVEMCQANTPDTKEQLKFYADEATRYRDLEWKLPAYSGAFMLAAMINKTQLTGLGIHEIYLTVVVASFGLFVFHAQLHVHLRLRQVRTQRDLLLKLGAPKGFGWSDFVYRCGFLGFNVVMSGGALAALWPPSWRTPTDQALPAAILVLALIVIAAVALLTFEKSTDQKQDDDTKG
jgi:hypothetical protein